MFLVLSSEHFRITEKNKIQGKMQERVKGRNLFFEVILFDLRNMPNIESIVSQSIEKAKNRAFF